MRRLFAPLLLVVPAFGFTCEYFDPVTVPATDTNPPTLATRYWVAGVEHLALWPVDETTSNPSIVVAPAMLDSGGAQRLDVAQDLYIRCHDDDADPELSQETHIWFFPRSATQSGSVGSSVSNGLYLVGDVSDLSDYEWYCDSGFDVVEVEYVWSITGRDFHGNVSHLDGNRIRWVP